MTLTMNKLAAGVVGLAMVAGLAFAFTATRAHAVSLSELVELFIALEVISPDKADEARAVLAGQGSETPAAPAMSCNFTRNLTTGDTGADVKELQKLLNTKGYTVAAAGAGSVGNETEYFGPATAGAVAKLQEAFAAEILTPLGLTAGTGFFGASTRAKANTLCSAGTPTVPGDDDDDTDDNGGDDDEDTDLSGEASLNTLEINSADDDTIEEGAEEAPIAELNVEFSDGDAMITRLDVSLVGTGDETDPWDTFDTIAIMVDDEVVAEMDASDKDEYLDDDAGTLRFTGLDIVAMEDEEIVIAVVATVAGSVDGTANGEAWTVAVDSMRFVDGDDVTSTDNSTGDLGDTVSFTVEAAGADDELIVKASASDPDSSIVKVESDTKSDWVTVFVFDLDTDDSVSDITLNTIPVTASTSHVAYGTLVDDARLVIDGTTIDSTSADVTNATATTVPAVINFDVDGDVVIEAGERVKAELQLRFKAIAPANEGATVQGSVTAANTAAIDAEGADDLTATGSATGDVHQLQSEGIFAEITSITETKTAGDNNANDVGDYKFVFDLTAFDDTFYVSATTSAVFVYHVEDGNGVTVATTSVAAVTSTATKEENAYRIDEGDTESFTLTVSLNPSTTGFYRVELDSVTFGTAAALPFGSVHTASPDVDFESDNLNLNA